MTVDFAALPAFRELMDVGRRTGSLSQDEICKALGPIELTQKLIDELVAYVRGAGVAIMDEEPTGSIPVVNGDSDPISQMVPAISARLAGRGVETARVTSGLSHTGVDAVRSYLREIGKVRLLTGPEEVGLARQVAEGQLARAALENPAVFEEAEYLHGHYTIGPNSTRRELREAVVAGLAAKEALVTANLRLVVSIAKRYRNRGLPFLDLIQEGNIGLMKAVDKFDYTRGFKFSTYATWWIRQSINRSLADQARLIRLPVHVVDQVNRVAHLRRQMIQELGREPTQAELSSRADMSLARIREIQHISQEPISLQEPLGDDEGFSLSDMIVDEETVTPSDAADQALLSDAVHQILADLSDRERQVVRMRFGLDGGHIRTLEEVGREFGVTRERVRQIEVKTLHKLRNPSVSRPLRPYFEDE